MGRQVEDSRGLAYNITKHGFIEIGTLGTVLRKTHCSVLLPYIPDTSHHFDGIHSEIRLNRFPGEHMPDFVGLARK